MLRHVAAAAFVAFAAYTARDLGYLHEAPQPSGSCRLLPGSDAFRSSEDVQEWSGGTVLVTAGDLRQVFHHGVENAAPGALYAVDLAANEPAARALPLVGCPPGLRFQPHGLYIRRPYIYAVSHAGGAAGSRVEVFEEETEDDRLTGARWVRSVSHPLLKPNGFPNDVVAAAPRAVPKWGRGDDAAETTWTVRGPRRLGLAIVCPTEDPNHGRGVDATRPPR